MARPSLPIELCERIIDASTYTLRFGDPTAIDYRTLRACALVCSAWLPRARHNLFFRVSVKSARGLRDLAAGAEACAWIRPREVQLTLPLRVSRPKGKGKGKGKGFKCNFKKQTPATPVVCGGNSFAQPASATKLRLGEQDSDEDDANISLVDPKVARVFSAVSTLTIVSSEWLFPQRYAALFGAQFSTENMRELRLYHVFFVTGRDLALLLWSFPALSAVECHCAIVKFGDASGRTGSGMGSWKLPPLPRRTGTVPPCAALRSLKVSECVGLCWLQFGGG
ncbi:hypothetical protein L227DRAFT_359283 [Lentinus tigrinus ALCF2SS1-6]|uniref:F-box domain-containing protein n=1 Tax=Lentinus tigrinus ALCF2SS1-6 TaxID=1328759 RepID=A0A5C2SJE5_9APHY|nr:hypothetical protein L227DRAFT_359283 [Lentinus tigrinus ALCF2SS1-6]